MAALNAVEEPFASPGLHFADGPLAQIWQDVKLRVLIDMASLALCAAQEASCSPAARALRKIVDEARNHDGLARIGFINRAINLAIKPAIDPFVWQSALGTLSAGAGDCKDYAVAKYFALLEAGFPERDVKLVIVRLIAAHQEFLESLLYPHKVLQSRELCFLPFLASWGMGGLKELQSLAGSRKQNVHKILRIP